MCGDFVCRFCLFVVAVVLGAVFCFFTSPVAVAQGSCTLYQETGGLASGHPEFAPKGPLESSEAAADADAAAVLPQLYQVAFQGKTQTSYAFNGCSAGLCTATASFRDPVSGEVWTNQGSVVAVNELTNQPCLPTNPCSSRAGTTVTTAVESGAQAPGTITYDAQGCAMEIQTQALTVQGCRGGCAEQQATYTGQQQSNGQPQSSPGSNCISSSDGTVCSEGPSGKNCGTFNGDEVCPQSLPPGSCQSYASGGIACTAAAGSSAVASPPGPNNGTAGQPATPTGQVSAPGTGSSAGSQVVTNYYNAATVAASTVGSPSSPGGANVGAGGNSSGSGSSGGGPNAANGDCGATGINCASDFSVPTLPDEPTIAQSSQSYYGSLSSVPIVAAVSNVGASIPSGQCPTAQIELLGKTFTLDEQCTLWDSVASVVQLCCLAMWTLLGIKILMSA